MGFQDAIRKQQQKRNEQVRNDREEQTRRSRVGAKQRDPLSVDFGGFLNEMREFKTSDGKTARVLTVRVTDTFDRMKDAEERVGRIVAPGEFHVTLREKCPLSEHVALHTANERVKYYTEFKTDEESRGVLKRGSDITLWMFGGVQATGSGALEAPAFVEVEGLTYECKKAGKREAEKVPSFRASTVCIQNDSSELERKLHEYMMNTPREQNWVTKLRTIPPSTIDVERAMIENKISKKEFDKEEQQGASRLSTKEVNKEVRAQWRKMISAEEMLMLNTSFCVRMKKDEPPSEEELERAFGDGQRVAWVEEIVWDRMNATTFGKFVSKNKNEANGEQVWMNLANAKVFQMQQEGRRHETDVRTVRRVQMNIRLFSSNLAELFGTTNAEALRALVPLYIEKVDYLVQAYVDELGTARFACNQFRDGVDNVYASVALCSKRVIPKFGEFVVRCGIPITYSLAYDIRNSFEESKWGQDEKERVERYILATKKNSSARIFNVCEAITQFSVPLDGTEDMDNAKKYGAYTEASSGGDGADDEACEETKGHIDEEDPTAPSEWKGYRFYVLTDITVTSAQLRTLRKWRRTIGHMASARRCSDALEAAINEQEPPAAAGITFPVQSVKKPLLLAWAVPREYWDPAKSHDTCKVSKDEEKRIAQEEQKVRAYIKARAEREKKEGTVQGENQTQAEDGVETAARILGSARTTVSSSSSSSHKDTSVQTTGVRDGRPGDENTAGSGTERKDDTRARGNTLTSDDDESGEEGDDTAENGSPKDERNTEEDDVEEGDKDEKEDKEEAEQETEEKEDREMDVDSDAEEAKVDCKAGGGVLARKRKGAGDEGAKRKLKRTESVILAKTGKDGKKAGRRRVGKTERK